MAKKRHWYFDDRRHHVRTAQVNEYPHGHLIKPHSHPWHQLIYASRGVMTVRTREGAWVVSPHRAVWVPARTRHSVQMSGAVSMRTLYLAPRLNSSLPDRCRAIDVSPLLRELILHMVELRDLHLQIPKHAHLVSVVLDQLHGIESGAVRLPMPRDSRARRIIDLLREQPSDSRSLLELSKLAGASKRTLERLFKSETGIGFGKWRQQLRLANALRLLAAGEAVTSVALEVGYGSTSAFIAAFRMTFGRTPGQYFRAT